MADLPEQRGTEAETLEALAACGYDVDLEVLDGELRMPDGAALDPAALLVDRTYRFEGTSDPDYQSLVLAISDPAGELHGRLVTAYGPSASPTEGEVLRALDDDPHRSS